MLVQHVAGLSGSRWECMRGQPVGLARHGQRARKLHVGNGPVRDFEPGLDDPDVEVCVVGDHDVVANKVAEGVEVVGKTQCGRDMLWLDAVDCDVAWVEPIKAARGLQQSVVGVGNLAVADSDRAYGAGRAAKPIGGFEVNGGEIHAWSNTPARIGASARNAFPRCEIAFFVSGSSSAAVLPRCGISTIGS